MLSSTRRIVPYTKVVLRPATVHTAASSVYMETSDRNNPAVSTTPQDLTPEQRATLDSALRVDQAGEVAANWIYKGQMFVLGRDPSVAPLIQVSCSQHSCGFSC
jgi:3-demethoxyubiquinol 3-hydroxylase